MMYYWNFIIYEKDDGQGHLSNATSVEVKAESFDAATKIMFDLIPEDLRKQRPGVMLKAVIAADHTK